VFLEVHVKRLVFEYTGMVQGFDHEKVVLDFWQLLVIEHEPFDSKLVPVLLLNAPMHDPVGPLSKFLHDAILLVEEVGVLKGGRDGLVLIVREKIVGRGGLGDVEIGG
jgi:hypothetical protein